ncbi:hypothetical protein RvY_14549 [Ramazzottius varieornatus]|uniref:Uncharacterized protein n=1 Tax=Ramazzottius varieornatus TaxID=947166 RepID=A0A1D1W053_RAMVA|nr:hypothetical protein RvY_14549 [Ramazzottius varieornatus]
MADDGRNGLDFLWEAALSRESADADLSDVVSSEITSSTPAVDSDVTEIPKPKRRSRNEMDSDTAAPRPKLTCEDETYERLLAPTEPELVPETEKEIKAQKKKDADASHSLRVLVDQNVKEVKEKHQKRPREFGNEEDPVNIVDQVIQSLARRKIISLRLYPRPIKEAPAQ